MRLIDVHCKKTKENTIQKSIVILPPCDNYSLYVVCLSEFINVYL